MVNHPNRSKRKLRNFVIEIDDVIDGKYTIREFRIISSNQVSAIDEAIETCRNLGWKDPKCAMCIEADI